MALLDPDKFKDQYDAAHTAMRPLWDNFDEYERLARNKPHPKVVSARMPTVTDGTLSAVITAQPKRIVQQIPTGMVKSIDQPELAEITGFIWRDYILKNANYNGTPLLKSWIMLRKALTYGMQASYNFFRASGDYYGADFSIPYIRDIIFERGKTYGPDCDVLYMRQWYTPDQIQVIIDRETKLSGKAKARNEVYSGAWDVGQLKRLKDTARQKDADAATPAEREKGLVNKYIEVIHGFQSGVGAKFYSFAPDLMDGAGGKESGNGIIRTRTNKDPRGKMPIEFLYADVDLSNAMGIGYPEISGGMQNLLDSEVQSYQLMQRLMLNPPVMKWGTGIRGATIKYKPNAVWDMGSDPNSKIEPVDINNHALANFPNNFGLLKSQILNMTANSQQNISAEAGNTNSKTPAGVAAGQEHLGFDDNYLRKQYEAWWEANAETMLNIHFAETNGKREIDLTEEFLENIMPNMQPGQPVDINEMKKKAVIDYTAIKTKLKYTVDPTTSESPDDAEQFAKLQELLKEAQNAPYLYYYLLNDGYQLKLGEAYKEAFKMIGVNNIDRIVVKMDQEGGPTPEQLRGVLNPLYDKPKVDLSYIDLPPNGQIQAAANAGIQLTMADVMMGPVFDQNLRGIDKNPGDEPNPLMPSGGAAAPADPNATPPDAQQPTTQVPTGQPVPTAGTPAPSAAAPTPPTPPPGMPKADRLLIETFLKEGYSAAQALHALSLAKHGETVEAIQATLGAPEGKKLGAA